MSDLAAILPGVRLASKAVDDPAIGDPRLGTALNHVVDMPAQRPQRRDLGIDRGQMSRGNLIHVLAGLIGIGGQREQATDVINRKAEIPRPSDEDQPPNEVRPISSLPARTPCRCRHQSDLLIVPNGLHGIACSARQLTDRKIHRLALEPTVTVDAIPKVPSHNQELVMAAQCCSGCASGAALDARYRRVLWAVLLVNAIMFTVEIGAGIAAGSASLQADALDFLGDAANYAVSLFVVGMALRYRALASVAKGVTMLAFGLWVVGIAVWNAAVGMLPHAFTMGSVGIAALLANLASFFLLWAYRTGDSNMRSAWICTRNDVLGNIAVLLAALGVFGSGAGWPDLAVAIVMAGLALQGAVAVLRQATAELRVDPLLRGRPSSQFPMDLQPSRRDDLITGRAAD
jgi:Co/Zn/Cd efflux system component